MSKHEFTATPFTAYDKEADYDEHIKPLVEKLHAECQRLEVPLFVVCSIKMQVSGNNTLAASAYFNGMETTPAELVAAYKAAHGDLEAVIGTLMADAERCRAAGATTEGMLAAGILEA